MGATSNSILCNPLWESFEGQMRKLGPPQSPLATWHRAAGSYTSPAFGGSSMPAVATATGRDGNGSSGPAATWHRAAGSFMSSAFGSSPTLAVATATGWDGNGSSGGNGPNAHDLPTTSQVGHCSYAEDYTQPDGS